MNRGASSTRRPRIRRSLLDLVFPPACPLCDSPLPRDLTPPTLCEPCQGAISTPSEELCDRCGRSRRHILDGGRCPGCRDESYAFSRVVCLGPYRGELSEGIVRMKHAGQQSLTAAIGRELAFRVRHTAEMGDLDVLVPVPMHWRRRILRGVGTSQMLAESIASDLGLPTTNQAVSCTRMTRKQSTLSSTARRNNMRGAFRVMDREAIAGLHVGLVDDTLTTGTTANEAAKILRRSGVAEISLIAVARAAGNNG